MDAQANRAIGYANDILQSIEYIEQDTAECTQISFGSDRRVRQLVERNLEIISEATRRLPEEETKNENAVPWHSIKSVGNIIRHEYRKVRSEVLWDVIAHHIQPLKEAVLRIRSRLTSASSLPQP